MAEDLESHLIELELRLQAPAIRKDAIAIADLLSDDFREFGASGRLWTRPAILEELAAQTPHPILSQDFACTHLSSDVALLTYVSISRNRRTLRSSLWRLEADRWRMVFHQGTAVPPDAGAAFQA